MRPEGGCTVGLVARPMARVSTAMNVSGEDIDKGRQEGRGNPKMAEKPGSN